MRNLLIILIWYVTIPVLQAQQNNAVRENQEAGITWVMYKVKAGETLYSIAKMHQVSLGELTGNNPQVAGGIKPGDLLKIRVRESSDTPAGTPANTSAVTPASIPVNQVQPEGEVHIILHKVQRKETFYFISRKYGVTIDEILAYNPGLSQLKRGETIRVPQRFYTSGKQETAGEPSSRNDAGRITHWVQPGETLYSISRKYGKSVASILEENPAAAELKSGMRLTISLGERGAGVSRPVSGYMEHTIARGETLYSVCKKYGVTADELISLNPALDKSFKTGTVIRVPRLEEEKSPLPVPGEKEGIRHIVASGETLFGLSRDYQVPVSDIVRSNPVLAGRPPKVGDTLLIIGGVKFLILPEIEKEEPKTASDCKLKSSHRNGETFHIVLLVPIMLESNRYLNREFLAGYKEPGQDDQGNSSDSVRAGRKTESYIRFQGNSENYLHFYEGVLLAIDSLRGMGIKAELEVLDSEQRSSKVKTLIEEGKLDDADLIIGPVYPDEQKEIASFVMEKKIPVVSPLSASDEVSGDNPWFFQVNPSREFITARKTEYVVSAFKNSQMIVLQTGKSKEEADAEVHMLRKEIEKSGQPGNTSVVKSVNYLEDGYTGLRDALVKGQKNVIIIPSDKEAEVSIAVSNIKSLASSFDITLIGSNRFPQFESINPESFHAGQLEFLTPYWPDYKNNEVTRSFVHKFRQYYKAEPNQFSMQGYDVTFFFTKALSDFGKDFRDCIPYATAELVQGSYHFTRRTEGGFINDGLIVVQYNDRYQVVRKNKGPN